MKISIKERRRAAGLRQEDLAGALNLSIAQYSRIEANPGRARGEQLEVIAKALGCTVQEIGSGKSPDTRALASIRRTVPVYSISQTNWSNEQMKLEQIAEYAPTTSVSTEAYAVEVEDDALAANGQRSVFNGDWCVVEPSVQPSKGDIVHALDLVSEESVLRIFAPLHPSNERAPGYLLKATNGSDDIFVSTKGRAKPVILGVVTEVRKLFRLT